MEMFEILSLESLETPNRKSCYPKFGKHATPEWKK